MYRWLWLVIIAVVAMPWVCAAPKTRTLALGAALPYSWPKTLLTYPLQFAPGEAKVVWVTDAAGALVPSELTDVREQDGAIVAGTVNFITDLPAGAQKSFTINWDTAAPAGMVIPRQNNAPRVTRPADGAEIISTGTCAVAIPALGEHPANAVTGPILGIGRADKLYGTSTWQVARPLKAWRVRQVLGSPLLRIYRIEYDFVDGASYAVTVRAAADLPYVDIIEDATGLGADTSQYWGLDLSDLQATEKYNHNDRGTPKWNPLAQDLNPTTGEWHFRLSPFYPKDNGYRHQMVGLRNANDALGFTVRYTELWQNDRYPIWGDDRYNGAFFFTKDDKTTVRFPVANGRQWFAFSSYPATQGERPLLNNTVWGEILDLNKMKDQIFAWKEPLGDARDRVFDVPATASRLTAFGFGTNGSWARLGFTQTGQEKNPSGSDRRLKEEIRAFDTKLSANAMAGNELTSALACAAHTAYLHSGDSYFPDNHMLGGHPNFMGDAKSPPGVFAAVLPNHPDAKLWRDHSERSVELLLRYHTRPAVDTWQARGGRATENSSCYMRGFMLGWSQCIAAMRYHGDGRNIIAKPHASDVGDFMVDILSAPYNGRRLVVQQGAHSGDILLPGEPYRILALGLKDYAPQTAENLVWAAKIGSDGKEGNVANVIGTKTAIDQLGNGTPPLLESAKFTGYGTIMRQGVDTPGEVYINMQQIDAGPNYRWGRAGDGGNGCLYYYAAGKRYTSHGGEDVGDASKTDTEATTSFGVWRDQSTGISRFKAAGQREPDRKDREGMFYSIGLNELTEPFYPFQIAQRSRLLANPAYAGPDYRARTGILVGGDYLILHDEITNPQAEGRFSWSIADSDEFPVIQQLRPGVNFTESAQPGNPAKSVPGYKRRYYTGKGDFLTFVSHKAGFKATVQPWGVEVSYDGGRDLLFQSLNLVTYQDERVKFTGNSAVVRLPKDGKPQVALYGAGTLTVDGFTITTTGDAGVSATITGAATAEGETFAQAGGTFSVTSMATLFDPRWLDGQQVLDGKMITVTPGKHIWQLGLAGIPPRPAPRTVSVLPNDVYRLNGSDSPGATSYRLEQLVADAWQPFTAPAITPQGMELTLKEPGKLVLRLVAIRSVPGQQTRESAPSAPFAVYVDKLPCRAPDGLKINLYSEQGPNIIWGQVQGAAKYLLERRTRGTDVWTKVYEGSATACIDTNAPTRAQYDAPGGDKLPIYEYRISASNGNGSTTNPLIRSSDPKDYLNIDPLPGDKFRRQVETYECYGEGAYDPWREEYEPILAPYPR